MALTTDSADNPHRGHGDGHNDSALRAKMIADFEDCLAWNCFTTDGMTIPAIAERLGVGFNRVRFILRRHRRRFNLEGREICTHEHPDPGD